MYRILVVEDEKRVAELLKKGLEESGYAVELASDGIKGLTLFASFSFDFVISDILMPKMDGLTFCKKIRQINPSVPILMLTALGTTDNKLEGFDAGADDYMVKPFDFRELDARIKVLMKRYEAANAQIIPDDMIYADLKIHLASQTVTRQGVNIKLTPKEYNLLLYMVQHAERVLTRKEIAKEVWNTHFDTGTNFIDVYISYLRNKIDKDFSTSLIKTRPGMGFILIDETNEDKN